MPICHLEQYLKRWSIKIKEFWSVIFLEHVTDFIKAGKSIYCQTTQNIVWPANLLHSLCVYIFSSIKRFWSSLVLFQLTAAHNYSRYCNWFRESWLCERHEKWLFCILNTLFVENKLGDEKKWLCSLLKRNFLFNWLMKLDCRIFFSPFFPFLVKELSWLWLYFYKLIANEMTFTLSYSRMNIKIVDVLRLETSIILKSNSVEWDSLLWPSMAQKFFLFRVSFYQIINTIAKTSTKAQRKLLIES